MLHAAALAFDHPVTGERMELTSPLPDDFLATVELLHGRGRGRPDT
jgi:23S rRNA pseudouridine1911/1915/1917 synthase